ncbi:MAG: phenylalanine--tRNA ligase subunit beta, partial [Chlamydiota bacterium]|nr:phenylalanine--tRNA ligase subunit beta [Chlamydiota bacterium]
MQVALSWLKEMWPHDASPEEIGSLLLKGGIEVDDIRALPSTCQGVITARIVALSPHPQADRLSLVTISDGREEYHLVCGDPECHIGQITAFAPVGSSLPHPSGKAKKMKKSRIRGIESMGMLCSAREVGLASPIEGIMRFPEGTPLGIPLEEEFADPLFSLSLTPNLGHAMSLLGLARTLAASSGKPYQKPEIPSFDGLTSPIHVTLSNSTLCPFYHHAILEKISQSPLPPHFLKRLKEAGIRPQLPIVDILNYVMYELGYPLHAFDRKRFATDCLSVRPAPRKMPITTLDGLSRHVEEGTLLIWEGAEPVAIAGVIGGESHKVREDSDHILIEATYFLPSAVRKASLGQNLRTEASSRFERGVDPNMAERALARAVSLIQELLGGQLTSYSLDTVSIPSRQIPCHTQAVNRLLGTQLLEGEITQHLQAIECQWREEHPGVYQVTPPSYRHDLHIEADLIEEIGRLHGYEKIPRKSPKITPSSLPNSPLFTMQQRIRSLMLKQGLQECLTCNLISPEEALIGLPEGCQPLSVMRPSARIHSTLRASLLPSFLKMAQTHLSHHHHTMACFEVGPLHFSREGLQRERSALALCMTGHFPDPTWQNRKKRENVDFYLMKGILETLFQQQNFPAMVCRPSQSPLFHPGRQAALLIEELQVGIMGELHPCLCEEKKIPHRILFAQVDIDDLLNLPQEDIPYSPPPAYPSSTRDWTLPLNGYLPASTLIHFIDKERPDLLEDRMIWDHYSPQPEGKEHHLTLRFIY